MSTIGIIELASQEARKSDENFMVGAVIHKKRKILSTGYNRADKTHPLAELSNFNVGHHAEMAAWLGVRHREYKDLEITVIRIAREDGSTKMARPCKNCERILIANGFKKIHYSNEFGGITTVRIGDLDERD